MNLKLLLLIGLFGISAKTGTYAQYFSDQGIYVLEYGKAAHGLIYRTVIDLPQNFHPDSIPGMIHNFAPDVYAHNANVVRIMSQTVTNTKYNKRFTRAKHYTFKRYQAELSFTTNPELIHPVTDIEFRDSLKNELLHDSAQQALIIIFSSPRLQDFDPYTANTFSFPGVKPCKMDRYTVCSFLVNEEVPLNFNVGYKNMFSINAKFGHVYFLEYLPTPAGTLMPADFLVSYRICKELQKINLDRKQMGEQ